MSKKTEKHIDILEELQKAVKNPIWISLSYKYKLLLVYYKDCDDLRFKTSTTTELFNKTFEYFNHIQNKENINRLIDLESLIMDYLILQGYKFEYADKSHIVSNFTVEIFLKDKSNWLKVSCIDEKLTGYKYKCIFKFETKENSIKKMFDKSFEFFNKEDL
ncbi:hypothetical protein [Arcobacter sp. CECT 9188]|uniref:hypothetical protein n=1 Tax=Arcobacter sp. CECT 9188 TaxID=2044505 RepID=UPI000DE8B9F0|nr:hypothetical protein [Arcobacter sp. CECT 9188]RBQ27638.1 hypothetical protein CRU88_02930 [Arcobacter sp. CECT 9188]